MPGALLSAFSVLTPFIFTITLWERRGYWLSLMNETIKAQGVKEKN